jgi:hypothetical protein
MRYSEKEGIVSLYYQLNGRLDRDDDNSEPMPDLCLLKEKATAMKDMVAAMTRISRDDLIDIGRNRKLMRELHDNALDVATHMANINAAIGNR